MNNKLGTVVVSDKACVFVRTSRDWATEAAVTLTRTRKKSENGEEVEEAFWKRG